MKRLICKTCTGTLANSADSDQASDQVLHCLVKLQGPVVQSVVSLTSSLRVISLTVLADLIHNILIFFAEKNVSSFCSKKIQHICVSLNVKFNESLANDIVSFEQLGPGSYRLNEIVLSAVQDHIPSLHRDSRPTRAVSALISIKTSVGIKRMTVFKTLKYM